MNSINHIPKAEIHVHLEATISPNLCRKFAKRNNVEISEDLFGQFWDHFLRTPKNIQNICLDNFRNF